jgi:organic hydroperoxide reductase OsmC/OhrA
MAEMTVALRNVPGTEAALGWAGSHTLVVDRAAGIAGGMGLGFNGGELLAFALGGCLCNDLRYAAHAEGVRLGDIAVRATVRIDGTPPVVSEAVLRVSCAAADGGEAREVVDRALGASIVLASVRQGFPVAIDRG